MNEDSAEESGVEMKIGRAREGKRECEGDRTTENEFGGEKKNQD